MYSFFSTRSKNISHMPLPYPTAPSIIPGMAQLITNQAQVCLISVIKCLQALPLCQTVIIFSFQMSSTPQPPGFVEGRDDLMWSLLQFISGSIAKNSTEEFVPVLGLLNVLYFEDSVPLPVPDTTKQESVKKLAATAIYIHLSNKVKKN
jgi:hypothetical protein